VTLYENDSFGGASLVRTANDSWLGAASWNDRASSVVVTAPASNAVATVYQDCNSAGYSVSLPAGNYDMAALQSAGVVNDDISSLTLNAGYTMTLYQDAAFTGTSSVQTASNSCLVAAGFNDNVTSLRIASGGGATPTRTNTPTATATARTTPTPTSRATATATARPTPTSGGISTTAWYSFPNKTSAKCIDARGSATANGTAVQQYTCNNSNAQQFQFQATDSGYYRLNNRNNAAQVWDVSGVSTADGALINLWAYGGGANQQWLPVSEGSGYYHFTARHSGKCIDVPNASAADSVQLQQWTCNGTGAQSWSLVAH
jgi:hypothetical protein